MIKSRYSGVKLALAAMAAFTMASTAAMADWPQDKPIRMIIPYAPGGATDIMGRVVSDSLSRHLDQIVVVENKPGAASMIGSEYVARADPDGYTLVLGSISNVLNAYFYKKPLYDIRTDLKPVTQIVTVPNFLGVNNDVPVKTVAELIALAKEKPGELSCAVSGVGSSPYLSCELLQVLTGTRLIIVPFKGGAPALQSTVAGQTTMFFANEAMPYITSGQVRPLGVTTVQRSQYAPDIPAIAETVPDYDVTAWYGVWAPGKTPPELVERIAEAVNATLKDEKVLATFKTLGATPVESDPGKFEAYVNAEIERWGEITRKMKVVPQ